MIQTPSVGIFFLLVFKFPITFSYYSETKCCWKRYFFFGIDMNLVGMAQKRGLLLLLFFFFLFRYRFSKRKFSNNECETGDCSKISLDLLFFLLKKTENLHWKLDASFDSSSARLCFIDLMEPKIYVLFVGFGTMLFALVVFFVSYWLVIKWHW